MFSSGSPLSSLIPEKREIMFFAIWENSFNAVCWIILIWCFHNILSEWSSHFFKCSFNVCFPFSYHYFLHRSEFNLFIPWFNCLDCPILAIHICVINFSLSWIHLSPTYFFSTSLPSLSVELGSSSCEFCNLCLSVCLSSLNFSCNSHYLLWIWYL